MVGPAPDEGGQAVGCREMTLQADKRSCNAGRFCPPCRQALPAAGAEDRKEPGVCSPGLPGVQVLGRPASWSVAWAGQVLVIVCTQMGMSGPGFWAENRGSQSPAPTRGRTHLPVLSCLPGLPLSEGTELSAGPSPSFPSM